MKRPYKGQWYVCDLSWWKVNDIAKKECIGKLIMTERIKDNYKYTFEFLEYIEGHGGFDTKKQETVGKLGYCLWVGKEHIIRKATKDDIRLALL